MAETDTSTRRGVMDFSPVKRDNANKENDAPVLMLTLFSKAPFVTFGSVKLGTSRSVILRVVNPTEDSEAEVTVEKIPSSRGFSVDHNTFTIQPEGSFSLTVTWTPTEEGGIRELILFNANGVLKQQAVLLGRAEAPKKKKKSLWDTIKNKREGENVAVPRRKKTEQPLKMAANKTFQVSRKPQYKRDKPRSPLASLNEGKAVRERSLSKLSPVDDYSQNSREKEALNFTQRQRSLGLSDLENIRHVQRNSPLVLLVPAGKLMNSGIMSACSDASVGKPESKDLTKILNRTLSPIGTPEMFKKLMPHILSDSPLSAPVNSDSDSVITGTPVLSLKDALALIDSDLSHIHTSPRDTSSSCGFSDSLESKSGNHGCGPDGNVLKALPDSPQGYESGEPRLTFFVSKKVDVTEVVAEADNATGRVKKASFTSATVIKSKAPVEANNSSGRKIKKSRRRLLEKTLELSDGSSQCESGPDTPGLPVIDPDKETKGWQSSEATFSLCGDGDQAQEFTFSGLTPRPDGSPIPITFPVTSPPSVAAARFSFSATSTPPASIDFTVSSPSPLGSSSPLYHNLMSPTVSVPPSVQEDSFPIHIAAKSKKRKSEEFLKSNATIEDAGKAERVKRSRVVAGKTEPPRSIQERRNASQRQPPRTAGSVRSMTTSSLKTVRSVVPAQAKQSSSKLTSQGARSLKSSGVSSTKTAKVVAVAQSKLTFIKPAQTAIPRHPMPFAAKNMFYDERWIEKQERGFTWWINYVLTPDDFKVNTEVAKVNAVSLAMGSDDKYGGPKAPTKEEMSFSTYTARRKLNRLRRSACQLFTSEAMVKAIQKLELEVEAKRLLIRKDRHLWKDIGERRKVLNWLLSYNPLWLRIGLETIFGELLSLESNSDALGLAMFILQRLLWNPDIAAQFRHAKVPNLYKDGHEEVLSRFTLKKLLLLVCFLDKAKESRLIEHNPCLFCLDAEFKTSKDLLLAFSRDFLSGEGILPRHLGYLGLPVSHVQTPLDEFNFAVKNLAVDLKCGIRLVRVMELLIQDWSLSAKLRLPAISRLQKVHNVDMALQVLKSKGVDLKTELGSNIDSRDIVDGHREKTLSLLWKIIFAFHVEVVLDEDQLREEIGFLKRTLRTKRRLASLRADRGLQMSPAKTKAPYEHSSTKITLLMDWVRAVCDFYNLKVENFTVAFSDGRVLCHLIHHYHPSLLPERVVSHSTTQTVECSPRGRLELNCSASDSDNSFDSLPTGLNDPDSPSVKFKELLENEKNNFGQVNTAVSFLGGVPAMINPADMSNTIPNEKVVMSYLSFLCARLLDLRNETRAARVIQGAWRKYRLKKDLQLYKERNIAASKIQLVVRSFLQKRRAKRQNQASIIIQSVWRGFAARNRLRLKKRAQLRALQHEAATVIQAQWRMFSVMRAYQRLRYYTIVVQAQWRMRRAASAYGRIYWAATVIQKHSRAWALAKRDREYYLSLRAAVVKIQRGYRGWKTKETEKENRAAKVIQAVFKKWYEEKMAKRTAAAVKIQSWYRMRMCLHQYRKIKRNTVLIQAQYRGHAQRRCFQMLKLQHHSAIVIQSAFRGHAVRKQVAKMRCAAVIIQRWFGASMERQMFVRMKCAAVTIQAAYRGKVARESLREQHKAATVIQAAFRKYAAQRRYLVLRKAAAVMQRKYRATMLARETKKDYDALRNAALVIQANWRGRADRKGIEKRHQCATLIQAHYRRHKAQAEYRSKKACAVVVQRRYRAYVAVKEMRKAFLHTRAACVTLQAGFRGMRVRTELRKNHWAATVIQSSVRMFLCKKQYFLLQSAAIIIQSRYRALLVCRAQQKEYRELKQATIRMQAVYRGFRAREDLKKKHNAARAIQTQFRMHRMRMAYLATKCAAIIIQDRYRAKMLRDQQMQRYRTMKSAAVIIQAAYRGHRARRKIVEMYRAATILQRKFLTIRERNSFLALKAAALACQQMYRAVTLARKVRLDYLSKRRAVICMQAAYRGCKVRKQLRIQHAAAVTIQSHFRKYQQRTFYKTLRWAVSVLQTRYRANKKMREEMQALSAKRNAAVVLQAAFRGMKSRRIVKQRHQAASVIQRAYRTQCEHKQYLTLKSSVLTIQRRYRATVAAKEQMQKFQTMRSVAVVLQAAYRGQRVRKEVARQHQAATVIQSAFRKHREEVKFQAMRLSAIIIQRQYRSWMLQRREREKYLKARHSAIVLQAAFRGHLVRTNIAKMHRAATVIQANFKWHKQQSAFRRQRWAACVLQQRFRAQRQRNLEMKHYQQCRNAVIMLQAAYRGMKSRRIIKQRHQAASVIQRAYGTHCEHKQYLKLKSSVLTIQRRYRATVAAKEQMQKYQTMCSAAVVLQAAYRGQQVRKEVARQHQAATVIQSAFRKHREEVKFQAMRLSAIIIQRCYRSCILQRREREKYLKARHSAIILQAAFRGHQVRTNIAKMHRAATVIQANFKRHKQQSAFRRQRWAACVLQQRFRAQRQRNTEVKHYQQVRKAAIMLQAAYRGLKLRQNIKQKHQAASVIQRAYRAHCEHKQYLNLKSSVLTIQRRYRATVAAKEQMQKFQTMCSAAVVLQAAYRGQQVRKEVARRHQAATVIQSAFRKHREEVKFQAMRLSAIIIQRQYRSWMLQRREREKYLKVRHSAIVLQAAFRGHLVRTNIAKMHRAATVIQANFKMHKQQSAFRRQRWAACVLQQRFRAQRQRNLEVKQYQLCRNGVIMLQAAYRGMKSRRIIKQRHQAASVIQRAYRTHCEHKQYLNLKSSVLTIQRRYRATVAAKEQMQKYQTMCSAAVVLQAAYRGQQVRKEIARQHQAATVIQSAFRKHREEVKFQAMRLSAIIIQRQYRSWMLQRREREKYLKARHSAIVLQAAIRGHLVRTNIAKMHRAATVIQANFKRYKQQSAFRRQRWAACVLQQRFRAQRQRNTEVKHYQQVRKAAIMLQAAYRGLKSRRIIKQRHQAASVIQRAYRAQCELKQYLNLKSSVLTIQRRYRATVAAKEQMQKYQTMRSAAVVLQAAYRGQQVRKEVARRHQSATVIQSAFRKHREEVKFQAMRLSAIIIQRYYRSCILQRQERAKYLIARHSAIVLQAAFRGHQVRTNIAKMHRAATVIQANFKRYKQQSAFRRQRWAACVLQQRFRAQRQRNTEVKHYQQCRNAVINLQAAFRGMKSRRIIKQRHQAASVVQRAYRGFSERQQYLKLKSSVLTIQRRYRAAVAAKAQRTQYLEMRSAAIIVQAAYRGQQVRKEVARWHQASIVIQSAFRKHREEVKFQAMRLSAIIIQRHYRSCMLQRQERETFLKMKQSTTTLQAAFRGWCVRRDLSRQNQAAIVIQSWWRCSVQRRIFQRKRETTVTIQRRVRAVQLGKLERNNYTQMRRAAITLQTHCRAWIARRQVLERAKAERRLRFTSAVFHHLSAIKIQRALRAHWALESAKRQIHSVITVQRWVKARQQRKRYLEDRRKVILAQRAVKRWLARRHKAASVIQRAVRKFLLLRRQKRVQQGIVKAQALWRGHRSRRLNDNAKVVKLRHRLRKVSASVREEDKLYNKTSSALDYLLRYKHFSYILEALRNLETATRLSPECCERLVESGATNVIFTLIRCCNRSVPCMDVITYSIQILLNLSKYHKTIDAVYSVDTSVETLLDLLQRYREKAGDKVAEKGGSIFTKACFLLALLLQDKHRAVEVMKQPKVLDKIHSIYRLTARKHKMDAERTVMKQKMNASINGTFFFEATPRKSRPVPKFAPDWVLKKDKLKDIVDPLRAIQLVANTLSIVL
ncbi:abnormal spindle-like microcephaly-associated protein isoform X1 [Sebastes umbrosus]|uniref:abnormal spindle-like microcephaly-associated protein isoform X1 n=1 Tax=Sebastes umbrosus TaxID=72105 RepID=UPI00189E6E75|nr:abnormal spindle-like microcephaly-associated protein isoform X1 [Sebastes umbrosus]